MTSIRVLLADDHMLVRAGFRALIETLPGIEVVAEANNGREALELIARHQPHVVLMDIAMPGLNGLEAVGRVSEEYPHVRAIILSMHANDEYVLRALRAGAAGYLLKDALPDELEMAIRAVAAGESYLSPVVSKHVAEYVRRTAKGESHALDRLTPRQREVLQLIAEGHTTQSIAHLLNLSTKTIETHRMNLMRTLDIHDIAGLVRYAIQQGVISPDC
ncbi:MAG: response regulator transcription factor [Anaerolineae bacterium]|jgi:DNA-binding NarL/FixJ family response regulator